MTEQVFEAERSIQNLKDFMLSENFTKEEVARKVAEVEETNKHQMMKLVKRLKIKKVDR